MPASRPVVAHLARPARRRRVVARLAGLVVVVALGAAACGGDVDQGAVAGDTVAPDPDATTTTSTPSTSSTTPPERADPSTVTVDGHPDLDPLNVELAAELAEAVPPVEVVAEAGGAGLGIDRACRGEVEIATSARRVTEAERVACGDRDVALVSLEVATLDGEVLVIYVAFPARDRPGVDAYVGLLLSDEGQDLVEAAGLERLDPTALEVARQAWAAA